MPAKFSISLTIIGDKFDPNEISEYLDCNPDDIWKLGDSVEGTIMKFKYNGWRITTGEVESLDFEKNLSELLKRVALFLPKLKSLSDKYEIEKELSIGLYLEDGETTTPVHFSKEAIKLLNEIEAEVDFDIYIF